ncbi:unnamed protein product [Blepharisma stoltei]|uniref:Uncharacterized protein n=1 Tax=Blepharisma stoltei TaxID=1481888 RepID=A0AAU9IAA4_9CILI|nr:unnamed protein product [Blepharisma stoltei]
MELEENLSSHMPYELDDEGLWMVPCKIDRVFRKYYPLCRPYVNDGNNNIRHPWTEREDDVLIELIQNRGPKRWKAIALSLNEKLHRGKEFRLGKQCRERWYNHLNPNLKKGEWSLEEDIKILSLQKKFGNRWSLISRELKGRTENSVKNRWKSIFKKSKKNENIEEIVGEIVEEKGGEVGEGEGGYSDSCGGENTPGSYEYELDNGIKYEENSEENSQNSPTSFLYM